MNLDNKIVAITGAGSGIGRALALSLASRGARVAGLDWNLSAMEETAALVRQGGGSCIAFRGDVSQPSAAEGFVHATVEAYGAVDALINNAGIIQAFVPFSRMTLEQIERVFAINWWGVVHMTRAFLPRLRERAEAHLVNIASMGGFCPVPGQGIYGASKAAVKLFTEALTLELEPTSVRVTVVFPGGVRTNIGANAPDISEADKKKQADSAKSSTYGLTADQAARIIVRGMERNAKRILVGNDSKLFDRLVRLAPKRAGSLMAMLMERNGISATDR